MINLTVVIDNDEAIRKLKELQGVAKTTTSSVVKDSERMDASWQQMKNTLMSLTAGVSFAALAKQVVQIRGEVQQLEVAFETMLGSKEKADVLMAQIIDLAAKTPFGLQDVSNATKMLLAYGSTAEEVTGEIKMLGNIASGLSIPLNDLIYLYGTTRTQGRMFTMDLHQFMGRGIPLAEELAKQFGVTKDKVGELVTAGKVGFDEMAKALQAMSSEGGKFYNLMDKQSQTISGQISNLEDAIYQMFNEIGKSSEGVISDLISGASWVVEHYQEILNVLKYVIAAYGSYKAAVMLVAAGHKVMALGSLALRIAHVGKAVTNLTQAMRVLNVVAKANPIGILASVLMTVATACFSFSKSTEEATKQMGEMEQAAYDEYIEVNRLVGRLQDANISENERNSILNKLKTVAPSIVDGLKDEANMTAQLTANLKDYNAEQIKRIQLAALDDEKVEEMKKVADARTTQAQAQLEWSKFISDYQAKRGAGGTPEIDLASRINQNGLYVTPRGKQREGIEEKIVEAIDKILLDEKTTDAYKALQLEQYLDFGGKVGRAEVDLKSIGGVDIEDAIETLNQSRDNVQQAEAAFDEFAQEDKQLREIIGSVADNTKKDSEDTRTYAQAFADAEKNYLETQKELAKANNDRKAGTSTLSEKAYLDLVDRAELAKKEYQKYGGVTSNKAQTEAQKQAKETAKLALELQNDVTQATIDAMKDGTDKKVNQIKFDYEKQKQALQQEQVELLEKQGTITPEQKEDFAYLEEKYSEAMKKQIAEVYRAEFSEMQNFLAEYGTFYQRKLAVAQDYDEKISKANTDAERKRLEAQKNKDLGSLTAQEFESAINWDVIFSDFGSMFAEYIRPEFEQLGAYMKTEEFANADASDKKVIIDAYNKLESILGERDASSFKALGRSMEELKQAQQVLKQRQQEYADTYDRLLKAQKKYEEALKNGTSEQIKAAAAEVEIYESLTVDASKRLTTAQNNAAEASDNVTKKATILQQAFDGTIEGLNQLSSASISTLLPALQTTFEGLGKFEGKFGKTMSNIAKTLGDKIGGIVGFILQIIDVLKEGLSNLVVPIIDAILNAVSGIIGDILNFRDGLFRQLGESLYKGILGIFRSILTLGGWFDWFGDGASDKSLSKDIERLSEVNTALQRSIDHLADVMDYDAATYNRQVSLLEQARDNTGSMMRRSAGAYDKGFLGVGGEHSSGNYIDKGMSAEEWERIGGIVGKTVDSSSDFFDLTSEDMLKIAREAPDLYGKIKDLANEGAEDASKYMDEYIAYAEQLEELEEKHNEFLTSTSFDQFRNEFKDALLDMEMSSEDFAENFNKMLVNSIAESLMVEKYEDDIKALWEKWASYMDGGLTDEERAELERDKQAIFDDMANDREMLNSIIGDASGQSATSKGFAAMSQDTGDELNGRFTDIQGQVHGIREAVEFMKSVNIQHLRQSESISETVSMIHNDTSLIASHTRVLGQMGADIASIKQSIKNGGI